MLTVGTGLTEEQRAWLLAVLDIAAGTSSNQCGVQPSSVSTPADGPQSPAGQSQPTGDFGDYLKQHAADSIGEILESLADDVSKGAEPAEAEGQAASPGKPPTQEESRSTAPGSPHEPPVEVGAEASATADHESSATAGKSGGSFAKGAKASVVAESIATLVEYHQQGKLTADNVGQIVGSIVVKTIKGSRLTLALNS